MAGALGLKRKVGGLVAGLWRGMAWPRRGRVPPRLTGLVPRRQLAWKLACSPAMSLPMNMFMMWMMGNGISIWTIMMVAAMCFSPVKALMSVGASA